VRPAEADIECVRGEHERSPPRSPSSFLLAALVGDEVRAN
jgi:hypothetical protein